MNLQMGSQIFRDVQIPLLWGSRAVVQDQERRLSVIDLSGGIAKLEIVGDKPAPGIEFVPTVEGFEVLADGEPVYSYNPDRKTLTSLALGLPECEIGASHTRVGSNIFSGNIVSGFGVGIKVSSKELAVGAPLPPGLAKLVI